jgi:hypothetical protein
MNDQQIIDLLLDLDETICGLRSRFTAHKHKETPSHRRVTEAVRILRDRQPTTIGELEKKDASNTQTTMNDQQIIDSIREAVIQAQAEQAETVTRKDHLRMRTTPSQYDFIGATEIEVTNNSIQLLRSGSLMRTYMTKEEALQLAANLIAIHTE